jgi:multidrug resistance efflux pump
MLTGIVQPLAGNETGSASGIVDHEFSSSPNLLTNVNPTSTWVCLAQRLPVRIDFDSVPDGVKLVAGQTATVIVQEPDKK